MISAVIVAAGIGFAIHVLYGQGWAAAYVDRAAGSGRLAGVLHQPYPPYVVVAALLAQVIPVAGKVVVFLLVRDKLPGQSRIVKGLWFGLLLLAATDALVRLPFMNALIGNPMDVVLVQGLEGWAIGLTVAVSIALIVP
jgi:hypothetical protein